MSERVNSNIRLGLFVLAGMFLLILTLYFIGKNQNLFGSNFAVRARFRNVNGLVNGNNIRFSGIQAGTVKSILIIDDTTIEVSMLIEDKMKPFIHKNAMASIGTEGLMGNKIVNILPGQTAAPLVEEGDLLPARKGINTDDMLLTLDRTNGNIAEISEQLKQTVLRVNSSKALWSVLNEPSLAANMKTSLANITLASARANAMVEDLRLVIRDMRNGKGPAGYLLTDTAFANNLEEAVTKIRLAGDRAAGLADALNNTARNIGQDIDHGPGTLHALLKDSGIVIKLNASLDHINKGTEAFSQDMEALKHNFLFRGYFRKLEKQQKKQAE